MTRFIRATDEEHLRTRFEQDMVGDVRLLLFIVPPTGLFIPGREEPQTARETKQLMEELVALSPKLRLEVFNPRADAEMAERFGITRTPALVLLPDDQAALGEAAGGSDDGAGADGANGGSGRGLVRFFGLPAGYEFSTLIEDILDVSRGQTQLSPATKQALETLPGPLHLQVFVTPT